MGQQIIPQPDGLFSVFSSVVDAFVLIDASEADVIQHFVDYAVRDARENVRRKLAQVKAGDGMAYCQFTKTWTEALAMHRQHPVSSDDHEIAARLNELERMAR